MEPEPSSDVLSDAIYERFHHQIREHGNTLISFVAEELHGAPPGISITLERLEMPPFHVSWVWFIGSMDQATEQAILRFFQTDAGKAALISHGADVVEFKIASVRLRLSPDQADKPVLPADLTAATGPLRGDQEGLIQTETQPRPICVPARTSGWLQVSPKMQFSPVSFFKVKGQASTDTGNIGAWIVDKNVSTAYGHVVAIVGPRDILVTPLTGHA